MYSIDLTEAAENDIREAWLWYEEQRLGLGKRFELEVDDAFSFLSREPEAFKVRYDSIRISYLSKFPFGIHYLIDTEIQSVLILRVYHIASNPRSWKN